MSLADQLAQIDVEGFHLSKGPTSACARLYAEHSDEETSAAVDDLRARTSWRFTQQRIDELLGVTEPIKLDQFRYHWRRQCSCWPRGMRA